MRPYNRKSEEDHVYLDNRDHIRTQVQLVLRKLKRRLEDEAFDRMDKEFREALAQGQLLELGTSVEDVKRMVAETASQLALDSNASGTE